MKYLSHTAMTAAAALLLSLSLPSSASDLGLDDRNQVGDRGVPQCFESTERTDRGIRHVTEGDGRQTQAFADFRKKHGIESIDRTDARPLEDPADTDTCRALGKKYLNEILEPHEGDPEHFDNVYANEAAYYRLGDFYVVVITDAESISPEHLRKRMEEEGMTRVQLGKRSYQVSVYDDRLDEVWSHKITL